MLKCPFDSITFHRKGNGTAEEIVQGGVELVKELAEEFPNLVGMKYSNELGFLLIDFERKLI